MVEILKDRPLLFVEAMGCWVATDGDDIYSMGGFTFTEGETYTIVINGAEYVTEAVTVEAPDGSMIVGVGNMEMLITGGDGTGDPYAATIMQDDGLTVFCFAWLDSEAMAEAYMVSLYEGVLTKGANIVLYDRNGNPVTYEGIETVSFNTDVDGEIATYTHGTATDEVAVALDLSAGNQTVTPAEADFMKTVIIKKPDNLKPENIRKGETVAGIPGELIGETMSKEVELNFADGDQTVEPDPDTLLSAVIIKKPDNLKPENIRKGETVAGIPGTMSAGGAESVPPSDINFYDYDGTIVAAWTLEELAAATELPTNPTHAGLTAQGWNWTLADLQAENRPMEVGQMYITNDGKTRLYIRIEAEGRMTLPLYISQTVENGVTIDWGDGATETLAGTGSVNTAHTYASIGDYVITLDPTDDCILGLGSGTGYCVLGNTNGVGCVYIHMLKKVEIGHRVTSIGPNAFQRCRNLESISIPNSVTSFGKYAFWTCYSFESVTIPNGVTSLENNLFTTCRELKSISIPNSVTKIGESVFNGSNLKRITLPNGVTSIGASAFASCETLVVVELSEQLQNIGYAAFNNCAFVNLTIPSSVTSIATSAFTNCYAAKEYHFKPTTPPTLVSTNTFTNISSDCIIYVPAGCLSAYQSATSWQTYASQMREEAA